MVWLVAWLGLAWLIAWLFVGDGRDSMDGEEAGSRRRQPKNLEALEVDLLKRCSSWW